MFPIINLNPINTFFSTFFSFYLAVCNFNTIKKYSRLFFTLFEMAFICVAVNRSPISTMHVFIRWWWWWWRSIHSNQFFKSNCKDYDTTLSVCLFSRCVCKCRILSVRMRTVVIKCNRNNLKVLILIGITWLLYVRIVYYVKRNLLRGNLYNFSAHKLWTRTIYFIWLTYLQNT